MCIYIYVYIYIMFMYLCTYIYIYINMHRYHPEIIDKPIEKNKNISTKMGKHEDSIFYLLQEEDDRDMYCIFNHSPHSYKTPRINHGSVDLHVFGTTEGCFCILVTVGWDIQ